MVIAVPTGIKIFSWLSCSLSKGKMVNTIINIKNIKASFSLYNKYPRSNRKYLKENKNVLDLVPFGINLISTVGYPKYTIILQHMVVLPNFIKNIIIGLLLSDG
jgi:heme/copper-type cytochrome/quinol oxidase subunit 1